jgi:hypothetical protein
MNVLSIYEWKEYEYILEPLVFTIKLYDYMNVQNKYVRIYIGVYVVWILCISVVYVFYVLKCFKCLNVYMLEM